MEGGTPIDRVESDDSSARLRRLFTVVLLLLILAIFISEVRRTPQGAFFLQERVQTFVTIFLGIFIEAVPFLLAGSVVSGFIHIFVDQRWLDRFIPHNLFLGPLSGAAMGLLFPVCECGVVPVTRRLYAKGLPVSIGVAFLLAAPVINPVVIVSTYAAFGWGPVLWGRIIFSLLIAFSVGMIFQLATPDEVLLPTVADGHDHHSHMIGQSFQARTLAALNTAGDDFLDMARYLSDCRIDARRVDADRHPPERVALCWSGTGDLGAGHAGIGLCAFGLLDGRCVPGAGLCRLLHNRLHCRFPNLRPHG